MNVIYFYYYATCKCQAPESWHALNRAASESNDFTVKYVQTQTGEGKERISELLGEGTLVHPPYISVNGGRLIPVSGYDKQPLNTWLDAALA